MYIIFEGIDTCGKSTQIERLKQLYPHILTTKEPAGTPFGQTAREILLSGQLHSKRAELFLFLADRAEHYTQLIKPNQPHKMILSDRGFLSGIAYALANGSDDFEFLMKLNHFALEDTMPDRIVLFVTDMQTLKERTSQKTLDGIELRGLEYLLEVQRHMKESLKKLDIPFTLIDATQNIETITDELIKILDL